LLADYKKGLMQQLFPTPSVIASETKQSAQTQAEEIATPSARNDEATAGLLPRLRFPDFCDAPPWEEKRLGDIFEITRGYVLATTETSTNLSESSPYPVYSSQTKNKGLMGFYSKYLYEDALTWTTDGANAGDVNLRLGRFYCTNVCGVLLNKEGYANLCVSELLNRVTPQYVSYVGNPKLMNGVMAKIKIPLPSLKEQRKIADCLTAVDVQIAVVSDQITQAQAFKKGLLQQLFV
jgi:type I restriction enzyme S subunit